MGLRMGGGAGVKVKLYTPLWVLKFYSYLLGKSQTSSSNTNLFNQISISRYRYLIIREVLVDFDSRLSHILTMKLALIIYSVIINVYAVSLIQTVPQMVFFARLLFFSTISGTLETIISFWICGQTHQKSDKIHALLDEFKANSLSDYEYNEWLMFKSIDRKTRIGFTIGRFVTMKCTSLLAVTWISKIIYCNHFSFADILIYAELHNSTCTNNVNGQWSK